MGKQRVPKAHQLPSGNWRVQVRDENGNRVSITEASEPAANYAALEFIEQRKRKAETGLTVGEAIDNYIEERTNILSPTTLREYRRIRKCDFQPLMNKPISRLKNCDYQGAINKEMKNGTRTKKTLSPKSIRNRYGLVCSAVKYADKYAPCDDVTFVQKDNIEVVIPLTDQITRLLEYVKDTDMELPVLLAAFCGMRKSEIMGLHCEDWDSKNKYLQIRRAYVYAGESEYVESRTKTTKSKRRINVPESIIPVLETCIKNKPKNARIVELTAPVISHRYYTAAKKAGMEGIKFHALRHYSASVMKALGVPDKYAAARLGHASDHMVKRVYQHIMNDIQSEYDNVSNKYFDALMLSISHDIAHDEDKSAL